MKIRGNTVGTTLKPEKALVKATNLTEEEKAQARKNIDVLPSVYAQDIVEAREDIAKAVFHVPQTLTEEQKAQARENIGAASADVIGDIEAALDSIIAIQNSLIGGGSA